VCIENTPDPGKSPYPIGSGDVVLSYQEEMSTVRRQALDQMTAHINSPLAFDKTAVGEDATAKIHAAFGQPGGMLPVNAGGDIRNVVMRLQPGALTTDVPAMSELFRSEAQLASGISDYVAGLASQGGMPANQTATAVQRITDEANMRWRLKNLIIEENMQVAARIVDAFDRQFGGTLFLTGSVGKIPDGAQGIKRHGDTLVELGIEANGDEMEYEVRIEAGSMTPAAQSQLVADIVELVNAASTVPEMAMSLDWDEITKNLVSALGFDPDRVLLSEAEKMAKQVTAMAGPGEVPIGEPVPV
jgi:hypothetical protein